MSIVIILVSILLGLAHICHCAYYNTAVIEQIDDRYFIKVGREYVDLIDLINTDSLLWPMMLWKPESPYFQMYISVYNKKYAEELLPRVQERINMDHIYVHQQGRFYYASKEGVYDWKFQGRSTSYLINALKQQNWGK